MTEAPMIFTMDKSRTHSPQDVFLFLRELESKEMIHAGQFILCNSDEYYEVVACEMLGKKTTTIVSVPSLSDGIPLEQGGKGVGG